VNKRTSFRECPCRRMADYKSRFPSFVGLLRDLFAPWGGSIFSGQTHRSHGVKVIIGIGFQVLNWYLTFNALGISIEIVDDKETGPTPISGRPKAILVLRFGHPPLRD
jgi:hypothetical protein